MQLNFKLKVPFSSLHRGTMICLNQNLFFMTHHIVILGSSWSWLYGSWIYNYLCNKGYHPWSSGFEPHSWHGVIKFVSDLQQVGGFLRFPPPIKLTATYNWNIVESGVQHHKTNHTVMLTKTTKNYLQTINFIHNISFTIFITQPCINFSHTQIHTYTFFKIHTTIIYTTISHFQSHFWCYTNIYEHIYNMCVLPYKITKQKNKNL